MFNVVLIAESSRLETLHNGLAKLPDISVICASDDPFEAWNQSSAKKNDVIFILDLPQEMAERFLPILKERSIPAVAIVDCANAGFSMMQKGAVNMLVRREAVAEYQDEYFFRMLLLRVKEAANKAGDTGPSRILKNPSYGSVTKMILIGSSTGGTEALASILQQMPANSPPILVAQHMPPVFTRLYAERLDNICKLSVWEAVDGDKLQNGLALIAPGDYHMELTKRGDSFAVRCHQGEKVLSQRPSVDVLFNSVAKTLGAASKKTIGIILTGMGSDGAAGLKAMRLQGAKTIGQDESSSVVYGMPKVAFDMGAVEKQLPLDSIANYVIDWMR